MHSAEHCVWRQVNIQAYLLWEQAGRPDGADFAGDARATLEAQLHAGKSVQDIEDALNAPEPKVSHHIVSAEYLLTRTWTDHTNQVSSNRAGWRHQVQNEGLQVLSWVQYMLKTCPTTWHPAQ